MKNKIAQRLTQYFAVVLLLFALLSGALFSYMFAQHTVDVSMTDLRAHAVSIAKTVANFTRNYQDGECKGGGFKSYLRFVGEFAMSDIYVLDRQGEIVILGEMEAPEKPVPQQALPLVERMFETNKTVSESFANHPVYSDHLIACAPVVDADGRTIYALLLSSPVNNIDHALRDGVYILSASLGMAMILAVLLSGLLSRRFVTPLHLMKDTTTRLMAGDYQAKTGIAQHDEIGTLAAHIDALSEQLAAIEEERRQLDEMRQNFFSDISHELRTPIAVLKGNLELLGGGLIAEPERRHEIERQLYADATHMERLVNDLLELTRLQNPRFKIEKNVINLIDVLSDTVSSMRRRATPKQIAIRLDDQSGPFPVMGDYGRLRQLMIILLDNAIKFSPDGSTVGLSARADGHTCEVVVEDHGVGMDEETRTHIFDRYFHNRSALNRSGTGLGLPIAKEIALRHDVSLSCESTPGEGTRFTLVFEACALPEE